MLNSNHNRPELYKSTYNWSKEGILIIDDDNFSHLLLEKIFSHKGATIYHAYTGYEAIDVITQYGENINVAIVDIIIPGPSGYEIVEKLYHLHQNITFIAYTADILRLDVERCAKAGFEKLFSKPMLPFKLVAEIEKLLLVKAKL
jgi:CheY-like chemotaxis protein